MNEKETALKDIEELKKELKEAQKEYRTIYRKLRREIQKSKQKIRCEKCKYCITDINTCAFPHKNRAYLHSLDDLGTTIRTKDTCTKAFNCEHYEEDGKSERSYSDLDEEIQDFWKKCYFNYWANLKYKNLVVEKPWENWYQHEIVQYRDEKELKK